jgi:serine/threonine protein kinase
MPADWEKVRELFLYAVGKLPAEEWECYIAKACAGDTELQRQTEHLLKRHRESGSFLEQPAAKLLDSGAFEGEPVNAITALEAGEAPGAVIGPYQLREKIGEGGFGVVFLAEQTQPIHRMVALKILKPGMDTRQVVARFEAERQTLALMDHPHIARMFDGGATATGRPYFVMELVKGIPITDFCGQNKLSIHARLELFVDVCQAVQHAHQKGIIHRDLKPSNVLVTMHDDKPVVKVIDFGIGKVMGQQRIDMTLPPTFPEPAPSSGQQPLAGNTLTTGLVQMMGTPLYMSPEQAEGNGQNLDTRSDIYSLGVLLYELLTGLTPFDKEQLRTMDLDEIRRLIREKEPPRPSMRLNAQEALTFSTQCRSDPKRLSRLLRRELDWIVIKCLQKDRDRRYDSAAALAEDVGRFLRGEPIRARPVSRRERLGKWARRKPALASLLAVCGLLLATLIVGGLVYNARLRAAVERAEDKEAETRRQYRQAHETLDRMLGRLESQRLAEVPQLKELQRSLLEDALAFYQVVLQRADSLDPRVRRDAAVACKRTADIQQMLGQFDAAAENYRRVIELTESLPTEDRDSPDVQRLQGGTYMNWGTMIRGLGRSDEAKQHNRAALERFERLVQERPDEPTLRNELAKAEHNRGVLFRDENPAEAESHYRRSAAIRTALVRDRPKEENYQADLAADYSDLGLLYKQTNRVAEAAALYPKAETLLRPLVDRHPAERKYALHLVSVYVNWSHLLANAGRPQDALERLDFAVRLAEEAHRREPKDGTARWQALQAHGARAEIREFVGRFADSVKDWDRVIELEDGPNRSRWRGTRARVLNLAGDHARAVAEAAQLATLPDATDYRIYFLAGVFTEAIRPALGDKKLSATQQKQLAERYAAQAMALLRKLQNKGYFQDGGHAKALRTDENLQPLRARTDFQALLRELEQKQRAK